MSRGCDTPKENDINKKSPVSIMYDMLIENMDTSSRPIACHNQLYNSLLHYIFNYILIYTYNIILYKYINIFYQNI